MEMKETFKASNRVELRATENGWLERRNCREWGTGVWDEVGRINTKSPALVWDALREFFQHERDQELERWRWPENPNWVAYPNEGGDTVTVLDETYPDEGGFTYRRGSHFLDYPHAAPAAKAYFAAHPKPKPWHEAVEGEVWLLMFPNSTQAWFVNGGYFQNVRTLTNINKTDPGITAGRRIWPEVSDA